MAVNLGSFGLGQGQDALQQALSARQQGGQPVPQLEQQLGTQTVPGAAPTGAATPTPAQGETVPQAPQMDPEKEFILKALVQRLKQIGEVESGANQAPPAMQPDAAMQAQMPMGGGYRRY